MNMFYWFGLFGWPVVEACKQEQYIPLCIVLVVTIIMAVIIENLWSKKKRLKALLVFAAYFLLFGLVIIISLFIVYLLLKGIYFLVGGDETTQRTRKRKDALLDLEILSADLDECLDASEKSQFASMASTLMSAEDPNSTYTADIDSFMSQWRYKLNHPSYYSEKYQSQLHDD